jgi:hypothetical protein
MGSGHTCYGMLTIRARGITWTTPASECKTSPYTVLERHDGPDGLRITFQLERRSAKCLFSVLVVTHKAKEDMDIGWDVTGYPTRDAAAGNRMDGTLACWLYRK